MGGQRSGRAACVRIVGEKHGAGRRVGICFIDVVVVIAAALMIG